MLISTMSQEDIIMGILSNILLGSIGAARVSCALNDISCATSRLQKSYKSLERQGQLIKMRKSLKASLEAVEAKDLSHDAEFLMKLDILNTYLRLTGRTVQKEEMHAAREAFRHGNLGPMEALARNDAELQDIIEEYF